MSLPLLLSILFAIILVLLLAWAVRPPAKTPRSPDAVFALLSEDRHYARLPQILQSLRPEDTEFLRKRNHADLLDRLREDRKRIAIRYLDYLEQEYRVLLEGSAILAQMAPELSALDEFGRFKQNLRFVLYCRYLRARLRLGLEPWSLFGIISDMAGDLTLRLEAATGRLAERAMLASSNPLLADKGSGNPA